LAYSGITPSVALMLDIFSGAAGGPYNNGGVLFNANGVAVSAANHYYDPSPLNIRAGNPINVTVRYVGGLMTATLFDTVALTTFTTNAFVDVPATVGTNTAFVGITGSEGGTLSHQTVSNFVFTPLPVLTPKISTTNTAVLTWPAVIGGYALQKTASLNPTSWQSVTNPVTQVNGQNQAIVPLAPSNVFYRLSLQ